MLLSWESPLAIPKQATSPRDGHESFPFPDVV